MSSAFEEKQNILMRAVKAKGFDQKYSIKKLLMSTRFYSIYLLSENEQTDTKDSVLLLDHPPAQEPSAHLLPIKIQESASKTNKMKDIVEAVHDYFDEKD